MRLAGLLGEGGRRRQDLRPGHGLGPEQMRETHVVADAEADLGKRQVGDHRPRARPVDRAFAPALAIVEIHVEHVDLVIGGDLVAIGTEQKGAVGNLAVTQLDRGRANMQMDAKLTRQIRRRLDDDIGILVAQHSHQARTILLHGTGHLRRLHIDSTLGRSLAHEPRHRSRVFLRIDTGAHLDGSSLEYHWICPFTEPAADRAHRRDPAREGRRSRRHGCRR